MISHFSGDSLVIDVPVVDEAGAPYPLAGLGLRYHARPAYFQDDEAVVLTDGDGITLLNASTARVSVPADAIVAIGDWLHSFTLSGGNVGTQTLWAEKINVLPV